MTRSAVGSDAAVSGADHVVIVTHGRSGSTLVQALLNSFDGWMIKGENMNFPRGLYEADRDMRLTLRDQWRDSSSPSAPWYAATTYDAAGFRADIAQALRRQLARGAGAETTTFGFKEIRFEQMTPDGPEPLLDYIDFLADALKPCRFILLSRDIKATSRSGWYAKMDPDEVAALLTPFHEALDQIARNRPHDAFRIDYADLKAGSARLLDMLGFLGLPRDEARVEAVLGASHSYKAGRRSAGGPPIFIPPKEWREAVQRGHDLFANGDEDGARAIYADHVRKVREGRIYRLPAAIAHRSGVPSFAYATAPRLRLAFFPVPGAADGEMLALLGAADRPGGAPIRFPDPVLTPDGLDAYDSFAIVRDPVERFVDTFAGAGADLPAELGLEPAFADINHFALNLAEARRLSLLADRLFCPQGKWLGERLDHIGAVYAADDLAAAARMVAERCGRPLDIPEAPAKPSLAALTRDALDAVIGAYRSDYALFGDLFSAERQIGAWKAAQT